MFEHLYERIPDFLVAVPYLGTFDVTPYLAALGVFVVLALAFRILHSVVLRQLARLSRMTRTRLDDVLIRVVESVSGWSYGAIALIIALRTLSWPGWFEMTLYASFLLIIFYEVIGALTILVNQAISRLVVKDADGDGVLDPGTETAGQMLSLVARILFWTLGLLFVLANLGIEITSLIAGLGIGGIAVGLALQSILGDLFSSFAIYFDKPFQVGDFIIVGDHMGTVERIGIKTTRLRALQGEEIVFANSELTSARVHNYKRMAERRVVFSFGVQYETPQELVERIPTLVTDIVHGIEGARLERAHFAAFGDSALTFEVVYHVLAGDYTVYMDIQQSVNLRLLETFAREGIEFAYPTQTLYLRKE